MGYRRIPTHGGIAIFMRRNTANMLPNRLLGATDGTIVARMLPLIFANTPCNPIRPLPTVKDLEPGWELETCRPAWY